MGTSINGPYLWVNPDTLTVYPVYPIILQLGPATDVLACESNSQVELIPSSSWYTLMMALGLVRALVLAYNAIRRLLVLTEPALSASAC